MHQAAEGHEHPLITLAEQGRQDVLAELVAPQMVAAITAGQARGVEIHPVGVVASCNAIAAGSDAPALKSKAALEAAVIDGNGGEVDGGVRHRVSRLTDAPKISRIRVDGK